MQQLRQPTHLRDAFLAPTVPGISPPLNLAPAIRKLTSTSEPLLGRRPNPPSMQQLRPPTHLRDFFLAPTVPGGLPPLKLAPAIITSASEPLLLGQLPANYLQEYPPLPLFPASPQQPPPPPPPQHQQHEDQNLASNAVPRIFLGDSTADALSTTAYEDDSANMDLTVRL
ncbi:hypothetical protein SLA2020_525930 [Shorea laevis]